MTWTWWMTLLAIFAALVLIGCIPVGVDARYNAEGVFLAAKLGPIRLQLLPQKPKKKKKQQKKPRHRRDLHQDRGRAARVLHGSWRQGRRHGDRAEREEDHCEASLPGHQDRLH